MNQEVFKENAGKVLIVPIIITTLFTFFYTNSDMPFWTLIILIVPVTLATAGLKTKVVVEDDTLHYQRIFSGDEVSLKEVSQIVTREVESYDEEDNKRRVHQVAYVLDESGATFFSFPAKLIKGKDQRRFEEAVMAVNSQIKMSH